MLNTWPSLITGLGIWGIFRFQNAKNMEGTPFCKVKLNLPNFLLHYTFFTVTICWHKSSVKPQAAHAKAKAKKALNMGSDQVISLRHDLWMSDFTLLRMRRYILTKK